MKWVTRKRIHVNRTATGWLIRRFLDPSGEILFVEPEEVASIQASLQKALAQLHVKRRQRH